MIQSIPLSCTKVEVKATPLKKIPNFDLILRCQQGIAPDRLAFAELIRRYQPYVEKLLSYLAPDWQDRADLAQEVWIRVYRKIKRVKEPVKFKGWLRSIITNLFYDELRKRKRRKPPLSLDAPHEMEDGEIGWKIASDYPIPSDDLTTREFYGKLKLALAELPESSRYIIVLREIEGLTYDEIAKITEVSLGTVKSRIARARAKLQTILPKYLELDS